MANTTTTCAIQGIEGNPDFYGLGIRLGFYFHWLGTLLVTIFRQEEEALYRVVNIHLQLAVFACLVFLTTTTSATAAAIHPPEVLIAFWLLLGALSSTTGDGITFFGTLAGTARFCMYAALSAYGVWFWFIGLDSTQFSTTPDPGCDYVGWFGAIPIRSPAFRGLGKAASVIGLAVCVGLLGYSCWLMISKAIKGGGYTPASTSETSKKTERPRAKVEITLVTLSITVIALSVGSIEYLISANGLTGVNDIFAVGQIIPLLVGAMGLATTFFEITWEKRVLEARCLMILRWHIT
ncbi:hypothetical protein B0H66DRAFT_585386 [Apodospora peruviana]|uniref:Uncharacterized protein n=1 Tax=Apodospora peruviana TaxID=516989 RepID=A0AAE0MDQ9_9PEZI|nr:hypothetical protein B0H66DRAFT_585386 [Apodospora peruviana]